MISEISSSIPLKVHAQGWRPVERLKLTVPRRFRHGPVHCLMKFTTSLRVRYAETDQMGVVYHGHYFSWFEIGRVEMMRSLGFSYSRMEQEEDCMLPVVEASCRYRRPARYDEMLTLVTLVQALRGAVVVFSYQLFRAGTLLADAETKHVAVNRTLERRRLPEPYRAALLQALAEGTGEAVGSPGVPAI